MLLLTGRVSSDVLMKAALREIPVLISLSAPTHLAIELAIEYGMTLVGFARATR
jgi:FdhD protein